MQPRALVPAAPRRHRSTTSLPPISRFSSDDRIKYFLGGGKPNKLSEGTLYSSRGFEWYPYRRQTNSLSF